MNHSDSACDWHALALRALSRCDQLALDSEVRGQITRRFCTPAMKTAHQRIGLWMSAAGLNWHVDPVGNLVGRSQPFATAPLPKQTSSNQRLLIGSHLDTVPNAGRFDGVLGVMIGLAVVEALQELAVGLPFGLEVIGFSDEEGVRYLSPYLGSRGIAGTFDKQLLNRRDEEGIPLHQALRDFGLDDGDIGAAQYCPEELVAFIEPHIEQGPVLESEGLPVGLVSAFAGQTRLHGRFLGVAGHAGTVPMSLRRDASLAAAKFNIAVHEYAQALEDLRATMGCLQAHPGASNVIPGEVTFSLDLRHAEDHIREQAAVDLLAVADEIATDTQTRFEVQLREDQPAVPTDPAVSRELAATIHSDWLVAPLLGERSRP